MRRAGGLLVALVALVMSAAQLGAQTGTITGRVNDRATMQPLEGVTLNVGSRTAVSGADGRYTVTSVPAGTYTLRATRLGYAEYTQQVTLASGQTLTVDIRMTVQALDIAGLVVVSYGYGERSKRDMTGVVQEVLAQSFNTGRIVSPQELIRAKVPGVQVIDTGEPGGGVSMRIRGGTSVTSSNEPLFVVDGVPLAVGGGLSAGRNPLNFLNPEDIESVTVLKDASATAIYGSRGANGVVLIETKTGTPGEQAGARMEYTGSMSSSSVIGDVSIMDAAQFKQAVSQKQPSKVSMLGNASTDWRDLVLRSAMGQEHSLAITGGTSDMDYRLSVGYLNQKGVVKGSETERLSMALNLSQVLLDQDLKVEASVKGSRALDIFTPGSVLGESTRMPPTQPVLDPAGAWGGYFEWGESNAPNNPVAALDFESDKGATYRSVGSVKADYEFPFLTGLVATVNAGYDITKTERAYFAPTYLKGQAESGLPGSVSRVNNTQMAKLLDAYVNYEAFVGGALDITAGYSYEDSRADYPSFNAQGLSFNNLGPDGVPASQQVRGFLSVDESRLVSGFARANYTYADRYLFTASVRRDGSSKFGPENQWGTFPAAAFAWRISDEAFMEDNGLFSELKFRLSWGKNGNQAFDNYQAFSSYRIGDPAARYQFGNEFVTTIRPSAADPGIKWEETTSTNIGFDFGLFDGRLTGAVDYYMKDTKDLINTVPVAAGTNLSNYVTTNIGSMENKGLEVSLSGDILTGEDDGLLWNGDLSFSTNDNELINISAAGAGDQGILTGGISGGVGSNIQIYRPGYPVRSFYVYKHKMVNGKPVWADTNGDKTINEKDLYEDLNSDGVVNQDDRRPYKNPVPDFQIGHTSFMQYRNLDASFTLMAYLGNYVYNNVASNLGNYRELSANLVPVNLHTSVLEYGFEDPQYFSDVYVEDASFLRMDNISVGYTFDRGRLEGMRVFGAVQNVFTLTGYSGIDPLAGFNGIDNNIYPRSRTFTAGLSYAF